MRGCSGSMKRAQAGRRISSSSRKCQRPSGPSKTGSGRGRRLRLTRSRASALGPRRARGDRERSARVPGAVSRGKFRPRLPPILAVASPGQLGDARTGTMAGPREEDVCPSDTWTTWPPPYPRRMTVSSSVAARSRWRATFARPSASRPPRSRTGLVAHRRRSRRTFMTPPARRHAPRSAATTRQQGAREAWHLGARMNRAARLGGGAMLRHDVAAQHVARTGADASCEVAGR
jgi:hypothetical protein